MASRHRRDKSRDQLWEIEGVSEYAQIVAAKAAADTDAPLEIWLADTVLRATQEGIIAPEEKTFVPTVRRSAT